MTGRALGPFLAALLLAGCIGPRQPVPPQAAVAPPPSWRDAPAAPQADVPADWWRAYGDDALATIVESALADNPDVAQAVARIRQAEAAVRFARGGMLPRVDAGGLGAARMKTYSPLGEAVDLSGYEAGIQASYTLDLFGRLSNATKSAQARLLATRASADTVRLAIVAQTVQTYIQLRLQDASLEIATRGLALRQAELARREAQLREGYADRLAVDQASGEVRSLEQQIPDLRSSIRDNENALSILIGRPPQAIPRGRPLADLVLPTPPVALPARLLRRRPDLYAAEQDVVAADRSLDVARAAFLPDITLSASGTRIDADLLPKPLNLYSLMGSVLAPIFQGGKLRAGADAATAQRDQAAFAYRAKALNAFREVENALSAGTELADQERATVAGAATAAATLATARRRYAAGYNSYFEVLDAERSALASQLAVANVRARRLAATVTLYGALGGGWTSPGPATPGDGPRR